MVVATSRAPTERLSLHGILSKFPQTLRDHYHAGIVLEPHSQRELAQTFERVKKHFSRVASVERAVALDSDMRPLTSDEEAIVEPYLARIRLYHPYDQLSTSINWFKVDRLVAAQLGIDLSRTQSTAAALRGATPDSLLSLMLNPDPSNPATRVRLNRNYMFSGSVEIESVSEDVRIFVPPVTKTLPVNSSDLNSAQASSIYFQTASGAPFVSVACFPVGGGKGRFVVYNGYHRIYAARAAGLEWVPAAFFSFPPAGVPSHHGDFTGEFLANPSSVLPLFCDYFDSELVVHLKYAPTVRVMKLNWDYQTALERQQGC